MTIERWDPFRDAIAFRDTFNRLFDENLLRPGSEWISSFRDRPAMDVYETDSEIHVEAHLPGIQREEVEVTISGNILTIKGERKAHEELKDEHYLRREVHYGMFTRRIAMPESADLEHVSASFSNGVLKISFPKQAVPQPKRIELEPEEVAV